MGEEQLGADFGSHVQHLILTALQLRRRLGHGVKVLQARTGQESSDTLDPCMKRPVTHGLSHRGELGDQPLCELLDLAALRHGVRLALAQFRLDRQQRIEPALAGGRRVLSALWLTGFRSRCAVRVIIWTEVRVRSRAWKERAPW
ncbi:hypothetical protein ACRJ4W_08920 [Streptomyces sp. GLT-R25]